MNVRFHRVAVAEIDHEVDYYESRQAGLGAEREDEIDAVLDLIRRLPQAAPQWKHRRDRRGVVLDRFPFTLPYRSPVARSSFSHWRIPAGVQATGRDGGRYRRSS